MAISSPWSFAGSLVPLGVPGGTGIVAASAMEEGGVTAAEAGVPGTVAGDPLPARGDESGTSLETTLTAMARVEGTTIHTALLPCLGILTVCPLLGAWEGLVQEVLPNQGWGGWGGALRQSDLGGVVG